MTYEEVNAFDDVVALVILPLMNDAVIVLTINEPVIFNEPERIGMFVYFK